MRYLSSPLPYDTRPVASQKLIPLLPTLYNGWGSHLVKSSSASMCLGIGE